PGNGYVQLAWNASPGAIKYSVFRSAGGGSQSLIASTAATTLTDKLVVNGTAYTYYVQAMYTGGSSFETDGQSATPTTVLITGGPFTLTQAGGMATISWNTNVLADSTLVYHNVKTKQTFTVK